MNENQEELASLYVLDRLDPTQRSAFEKQLAGDPSLVALVRELESVFAQRIRALPQQRPSDHVLARIQGEIAESSTRDRADTKSTRRAWPQRVVWAIAAAVVMGFAVFGARTWLAQGAAQRGDRVLLVALDPKGNSIQMLNLPTATGDADARFVELATMAENVSAMPTNRAGASVTGAERGGSYALFDPRSRQGFVVLQQLPPLPEGKRYCIWLVDTQSRTMAPAGVIPTDGQRGVYFFNLEGSDKLAADHADFVVTTEDAGRAVTPGAHPKGKVVLGKKEI